MAKKDAQSRRRPRHPQPPAPVDEADFPVVAHLTSPHPEDTAAAGPKGGWPDRMPPPQPFSGNMRRDPAQWMKKKEK